jgi:hypothetical protein
MADLIRSVGIKLNIAENTNQFSVFVIPKQKADDAGGTAGDRLRVSTALDGGCTSAPFI